MSLHVHSIEDVTIEQPRYGAAQIILEKVSAAYDVPINEMLSDRRQRRTVTARHIAMYLIREHTGYSFPRIGRIMNKDHTTVISACRKMHRALNGAVAVAQRIRELAE